MTESSQVLMPLQYATSWGMPFVILVFNIKNKTGRETGSGMGRKWLVPLFPLKCKGELNTNAVSQLALPECGT